MGAGRRIPKLSDEADFEMLLEEFIENNSSAALRVGGGGYRERADFIFEHFSEKTQNTDLV